MNFLQVQFSSLRKFHVVEATTDGVRATLNMGWRFLGGVGWVFLFGAFPSLATPLNPRPIATCQTLLEAKAVLGASNALYPVVEIGDRTEDLSTPTRPLAGFRDAVAVLILNSARDSLLMGLRGRGNGKGTWGLPGGKLDVDPFDSRMNESVFSAAKREVVEETGMTVHTVKLAHVELSREEDGRSYRVFIVIATIHEGSPVIQDPEEVLKLEYIPLPEIPNLKEGLFKPLPIDRLQIMLGAARKSP